MNFLYEFEVVPYGFAGIYPVIGVIYKDESAPKIEEVVIQSLTK